jgi:CheY-like chemotaxis protein
VAVSDTGAGIDAATRERIFEPFFTTKEPGKGSGLGLATAYGIVNQAGGSLAVSSTPGGGTTFRMHLPLAAAELAVPTPPIAEPVTPKGGRETVLLVEDEAALRELEQVTLEDAGYRVHAAANAQEALELAGRHAFDLLVVDVVMPGLSGPQLVEELRSRGHELPAIFVSGYGSDEFSSRGLLAGKATVVEKPFAADTLLAKVREALDDSANDAVADPPASPDGPEPDYSAGLEAIRRSDRSLDVDPEPDARPALAVRCLACGARYRRPGGRDTVARSCCPRCDYVGWAAIE